MKVPTPPTSSKPHIERVARETDKKILEHVEKTLKAVRLEFKAKIKSGKFPKDHSGDFYIVMDDEGNKIESNFYRPMSPVQILELYKKGINFHFKDSVKKGFAFIN